MSGIVMGATDVRDRELQGAVGDCAANSDFDRWGSGINASPQAKQVTTVTVTDQGDSDTITITINGFDVVCSSGTGLDAAGIGAVIAAAINADPRVRGDVIATFATVTLTLTAVVPGLAFTVSIAGDASSVLSAVTAVTAAAEAADIPVGRVVISQGYQTGEADKLVALCAAALFTAQVITVTPTYVSGAVITAFVYEVRGGERVLIKSVSETSATNLATTLAALLAGLNTALPANSVVVTGGVTELTFTAEVPGTEFAVEFSSDDSGASVPTFTTVNTTGPSNATALWRSIEGISQRPLDEECLTIGGDEPVWPGNGGVRFWKSAQVYVESAEAISTGGSVWVETGVAADNGQLFAATGATRIALPAAFARWERDGRVAGDNLAVVRLNIP